jgi:hypothetical protein
VGGRGNSCARCMPGATGGPWGGQQGRHLLEGQVPPAGLRSLALALRNGILALRREVGLAIESCYVL